MVSRFVLAQDAMIIAALSGGPDSVYLVHWSRKRFSRILLGHVNHGARGRESEEDQRFVEKISRRIGLPLEVGMVAVPRRIHPRSYRGGEKGTTSFEEKARDVRYAFLREMKRKHRAGKILVAHTADDQVETVLMRILEGAGIGGVTGSP